MPARRPLNVITEMAVGATSDSFQPSNEGLKALQDRVARNRAKLLENDKTVTFAEAAQVQTIESRPDVDAANQPHKEKTAAKKKYLKRKLERKKHQRKSQVLNAELQAGNGTEHVDHAETPEERLARKRMLKAARRAQNSTAADGHAQEEVPIVSEPTTQPTSSSAMNVEAIHEEEEVPAKSIKAIEKAAKAIRKAEKRKAAAMLEEQVEADKEQGRRDVIELQAMPRFPKPKKAPPPNAEMLAQLHIAEELRDGKRVAANLTLPLSDLVEDGQPLLNANSLKRLEEQNIERLFAVQATVLPLMLSSRANLRRRTRMAQRDLCVNAPTGSGKTLAYVLPLIELLSRESYHSFRAMIVLPTQDLAIQIKETFDTFSKGTKLKTTLLTGNRQICQHALNNVSSIPDIIITTPGRLIDHILEHTLSLADLQYLVVDEADRLLNQDFNDWLPIVTEALSEIEEKRAKDSIMSCDLPISDLGMPQKLLFSATLSRDPVKIASLNLTKPLYVAITDQVDDSINLSHADFSLPATLTEHLTVISGGIKPLALVYLTSRFNIIQGLCFTKSTEAATRLVALLTFLTGELPELASSLTFRAFSSTMPVKERTHILTDFKNGKISFLVCSDLISRGIDIPNVLHVINYDAPVDMRKYVHRVGRTARAGELGSAWTLAEEQEAAFFKNMMRDAGRMDKMKRVKLKAAEYESLMPGYQRALDKLRDMVSKGTKPT